MAATDTAGRDRRLTFLEKKVDSLVECLAIGIRSNLGRLGPDDYNRRLKEAQLGILAVCDFHNHAPILTAAEIVVK